MNMVEVERRIEEVEKRFNAKIREIYPEFYKEGYRFYTNKSDKEQEECVARLRVKGLEVKVGNTAFDLALKPLSTYVCIFVRG